SLPSMKKPSWVYIVGPLGGRVGGSVVSVGSVVSGAGLGELLGPRVVGLAARRALHLVDEEQGLGHLVPGEVLVAVGAEVLEGGRGALPGLDDGGDPLAPPLVGDADDDGVEHARVGLERLL